MPVEIWINPSCSKCASAKSALDDAGVDYRLRHYLEDVPSVEELDDALRRLGREPWDITRFGEPVATELGLADLPRDRAKWLRILAEHPILIQRPIIFTDDGGAVIGRGPDALRAVLE